MCVGHDIRTRLVGYARVPVLHVAVVLHEVYEVVGDSACDVWQSQVTVLWYERWTGIYQMTTFAAVG